MKEITEAHREAMHLAEQAESQKAHGDQQSSRVLLCQAFEQERRAASLVEGQTDLEPTRSVLHRSAASLALECGELREAERLIATGLSGCPPDDIADELRDLLEQVYFERHLSLRGIKLNPCEFQFSVAGEAVGFGIAEADSVLERLSHLEKLLYRTAERKMNRPFRPRGGVRKEIRDELGIYLSVPRAASFAVSLKVGQKEQLSLPGMNLAEVVVVEVLDCIDLYSQGRFEELVQRIPDKDYYENFVGLTQTIAPDGTRVRSVGFTAFQPEGERRIIILRPPVRSGQSPKRKDGQEVKVQGILRAADARSEEKGVIVVINSKGEEHRVRVAVGKMDDIVRPMFDYEVVITGTRKGGNIILSDIQRAE